MQSCAKLRHVRKTKFDRRQWNGTICTLDSTGRQPTEVERNKWDKKKKQTAQPPIRTRNLLISSEKRLRRPAVVPSFRSKLSSTCLVRVGLNRSLRRQSPQMSHSRL